MSKIELRNQVIQLIMQGHSVCNACNKVGFSRMAISNLKRRNPSFARKLLCAQAVGSIRKIITYQTVKPKKV